MSVREGCRRRRSFFLHRDGPRGLIDDRAVGLFRGVRHPAVENAAEKAEIPQLAGACDQVAALGDSDRAPRELKVLPRGLLEQRQVALEAGDILTVILKRDHPQPPFAPLRFHFGLRRRASGYLDLGSDQDRAVRRVSALIVKSGDN